MTATYIPGQGMLVTIDGANEGMTILLPSRMTIAAIQRHLREVTEWLS